MSMSLDPLAHRPIDRNMSMYITKQYWLSQRRALSNNLCMNDIVFCVYNCLTYSIIAVRKYFDASTPLSHRVC